MNPKFGLSLKNRLSNIKLLPLVAGTLSLALSTAIVPVVFAQSNTPPAPTQSRQNWLNLTQEQQEQMQQIKQAKQEQIDNILTAEQRSLVEAARENGEHPRRVFQSLNLTDEQQAQMEEVRQTAKEQMDAILTAEQRQQLEQHRQSRPQGMRTPQ